MVGSARLGRDRVWRKLGVGLTDPTKLTDTFGSSSDAVVERYVALGVACACVFVAIHIWSIVSCARVCERVQSKFGSI